jgi:membrane protein implicated in regulation of membrane protease activity
MNLKKYLLFQIPGWVVGIGLLLFLWDSFGLPFWLVAGFLVLWVVKDFAIYPFIRTAINADVKTGPSELIGKRGVARERLEPRGYIQVGGELWRAEIASGHQPILPGSPVRVQTARGLTLIVAAANEQPPALLNREEG